MRDGRTCYVSSCILFLGCRRRTSSKDADCRSWLLSQIGTNFFHRDVEVKGLAKRSEGMANRSEGLANRSEGLGGRAGLSIKVRGWGRAGLEIMRLGRRLVG